MKKPCTLFLALLLSSFFSIIHAAKTFEEATPEPPARDITFGVLQLINADTDTSILEIIDGATYALDAVGSNLNINAIPPQAVGSVRFTSSDGYTRTEGVAPYAYRGDTSGNYIAWTPTEGTLSFTVQYFSGGSGSGTLLATDTFSITFVQTATDTQAPSAPVATSGAITTSSVELSWTASTDDIGVTGYNVYKDGVLESTLGNVLAYTATGLTEATSYDFTVTALDAAGNESAPSNVVTVTTGTTADTQAPSAPVASNGAITPNSVELSWTASTDNTGVTGYNVYIDGALGSSLGNLLTYTATGLTEATSYDFTVTALDAAGNESAPSNVVTVTTTSTGGTGTVWNLTNNNAYYNAGNVGIGTTDPGTWKLAVNGNLRAKEIKVETGWADYVFEKDYPLPTLEQVAAHIKTKGHLINIPSAAEVAENGIFLGEMNKLLLEKIEELTLYILAQERAQQELKARVEELERLSNQENRARE
ncbi:fibronectin type III domain-containing protein [Flavobacteriaceae bacterium TP-CH-4]|uniref:Fibronectin type III domain-containing protein n=1 Tax=Pelagihabitans pacificus TaxID=2696054 RepID=A0A967E5V5_9FLAO|nr:fibronectin type III domain-containing protein [Pelagihabitans pacificus]NHF58980.1 fibronectin type III domain-containing protein [Pelagihabitans pacificus]